MKIIKTEIYPVGMNKIKSPLNDMSFEGDK